MKKMIFSAIVLCTLLSCSGGNTAKENNATAGNNTGNNSSAEMQSMIAKNEMVNRAFETGNFNGIDTLWTDDVVDHSGPMGKEIHGKDSLKAELMRMSKSMKDIKIESRSYAYDPDKSLFYALSRFTGTTVSPMFGMPANTKIDMNGIDVLKIVNGKASEHWSYNDPNDMMKMMAPQKNGSK